MLRAEILEFMELIKEEARPIIARVPAGGWGRMNTLGWSCFIDCLGPLYDEKPPISDEEFAKNVQRALTNFGEVLAAIVALSEEPLAK